MTKNRLKHFSFISILKVPKLLHLLLVAKYKHHLLSLFRGPFKHSMSDSFHSLQKRIAAETPCNVKLLALSQVYWKFEKPQNAPHKLMSNEMGYEALISGVKGDKRVDTIVMIFMPPPAKDLVCSYFWSCIGYLPFGTGMGYRRSGSS